MNNKYIFFSLLASISFNLHAYDFKYLKLNRSFKERSIQDSKLAKNKSSTIIQEIKNFLVDNHHQIGSRETQSIKRNHRAQNGFLNFAGFSWNKSFASFSINANRVIAPKLHEDKWIVHDTFTIYIDANRLIKKMRDKGQISINDTDLEAFAGLQFQRTYHYYHFADTYLEGLTSDYSRLFLSLDKFKIDTFNKLSSYEIIKMQDTFSFQAGGLINIPVEPGVDIRIGALTEISYQSEILIQALGAQDRKKRDELLRISVDKEHIKNTNIHLDAQLDFFHLLKLTFLEYDLEYSYASADQLYLSLYKEDLKEIQNDSGMREEFKRVLKTNVKDIYYLGHRVTQKENRIKENLNSRFSFLLLGQIKKRATEQIKIVKNGIEKTFFKHYSQSLKYVQSLLSRIFSAAILKVFNFPSRVKNKLEIGKEMIIEYEDEKDLPPTFVSNEDKYSLELNFHLKTLYTHKWYHKKYKRQALLFLNNYTTLDDKIIKQVDRRKIIGPINIESRFLITKNTLKFFNELNEQQVVDAFKDVCTYRQKISVIRRQYSNIRKLDKFCFATLSKRYASYRKEIEEFKRVDLEKLKSFLGKYLSYTRDISDLDQIFGKDNYFLHGQFTGRTLDRRLFQSYFKTGRFAGLGVINDFRKED